MLKILQARLQQHVNRELPDVQAGFRKDRGTRDQIANICWIIEKAREFQKNIFFCFTDYAKAFVWITTNCGKFFKKWEYQTTFGEGNGNPLQCSCLENPRDGGACWPAVYGVAQSRTRLKRLTSSSSSRPPYLPPEKLVCRSRSNS